MSGTRHQAQPACWRAHSCWWGWGRDGEGVRFLALLEHCCFLMNENLAQPVRGPIVADFGYLNFLCLSSPPPPLTPASAPAVSWMGTLSGSAGEGVPFCVRF